MSREKYTLSLDEKKELTNIAIHEGLDKAFHRLMEIAVEKFYQFLAISTYQHSL